MAQPTADVPVSGFRSTLRNKYFTRLWIAQLISQTIQNATNYGAFVIPASIAANRGNLAAVGGVFISFSLPNVLFSIPAGVLTDRFNKGLILWLSNLARAVVAFGFVISLLINDSSITPIYILTFIIATIGQFFGPAEGAAIPRLVKKEELVPALSLFNTTFTLSQALGFIIVGPLVFKFAPTIRIPAGSKTLVLEGKHELFLLVGFLYIVCAALCFSIPREKLNSTFAPGAETLRTIGSIWRGVIETGDFVRKDSRLLIAVIELTLGGLIVNLVGLIAPSFSQIFMNQKAEDAALFIFLPAGIGLVGGSVLMPRVIDRVGLAFAEITGILGVGTTIVLLTFANWVVKKVDPIHWYTSFPYVASVIVLCLCIGLGLSLINLPAQTAMQQRSPDWIKGRVLSLQQMLQNGAILPAVPLLSAAAALYGLPPALNGLAVVIVISGGACVYFSERIGLNSRPLLAGLNSALPSLHQKKSLKIEPVKLPASDVKPTSGNDGQQDDHNVPLQSKPTHSE